MVSQITITKGFRGMWDFLGIRHESGDYQRFSGIASAITGFANFKVSQAMSPSGILPNLPMIPYVTSTKTGQNISISKVVFPSFQLSTQPNSNYKLYRTPRIAKTGFMQYKTGVAYFSTHVSFSVAQLSSRNGVNRSVNFHFP